MEKNEQDIKERVRLSIEKSMSVIEKLCPQNNVQLGIKVRDTYHKNEVPNFSMFTACEMLWAITSSRLYTKAHYLTVELLKTISRELEDTYFIKQDRTFEKAFILLAITAAGQSITSNIYLDTINSILNTQKEDGSWGSYSSGNSDIRATALCLLALTSCYQYVGSGENTQSPFSKIEGAMSKSCMWLINQYSSDGYCMRRIVNFEEYSDQYTIGIELTAWSTYALIEAKRCFESFTKTNQLTSAIQKSIQWICKLDPNVISKTPENEIEEYKKDKSSNEIICHPYGAGGLEVIIITLIAYRKSPDYKFINKFDELIKRLIECLLEHENENGEWWDKNSDSYGKVWTLSYALKALSVYYEYLCENEAFIIQLKYRSIEIVSSVLAWLHKYKFTFIFAIATILVVIFRHEIETKISFFNSPIATAIGILLSFIGVIQGRSKR